MARIQLFDEASNHSEAEQQILKRLPINLVRGLLRTTPGIANAYLDFGKSLLRSPLPPKLYEMAILRVSVLSSCLYERLQHIVRARNAGVTEEDILAIDNGVYEKLTNQEAAMLRFVDEAVARPKASATFDAALAHLGQDGVAIVTLIVGHYMMTARFLETLEIEMDEELPSWEKF